MASYRSIGGQLVEEHGEVFSARRYGSIEQARHAADEKAVTLRRQGFKVKRTFSYEFDAYHVSYWREP